MKKNDGEATADPAGRASRSRRLPKMEIGARRAGVRRRPVDLLSPQTEGEPLRRTTALRPLWLRSTIPPALGLEIRGGGHTTYQSRPPMLTRQRLANELDSLGITFQVNYRRDGAGRPEKGFLAIYELDSQRRLSEVLGNGLEDERGSALETLVRARGPIPPEILRRIGATVNMGESYEYVAGRMNQLRIVDGMRGKGWTAKKIRDAYDVYEQHLRDQHAPRVEAATAV